MSHTKFTGVDYRSGCNSTNTLYFGECYQHRQGSGVIVPEYVNVTKVPDYALSPNPSGIAPYPSPMPNGPDCYLVPDCSPGNPVCGGLDPKSALPCAKTVVDYNCYAPTTGVIDFNTCRKIGFKNVQAKKVWHGRFGFLSHDPGGCTTPLGDDCYDCNFEPLQASPSTTKYLSCTRSASVSFIAPDGSTVLWNEAYQQTLTVNRYNGVLTLSNCSSSSTDYSGHWDMLNQVIGTQYSCAGFSNPTATYSCLANAYLANPGSPDLSSCGYNASEVPILNVTASDTQVSIDTLYASSNFFYRVTFSVTLGTPYTAADVYSDTTGLLAKWDLTDDIAYPWRTDEYCTVAPIVCYNEVGSPVSPDVILWGCTVDNGSGVQIPWTDANALIYDGSILGAPLPHGYHNHYAWTHQTWQACNSVLGGTAYFPAYKGAWSAIGNAGDPTDSVVPATATQWTANYDAAFLTPGAWVDYHNGVMTAQKWAEVQITRPSYNFARPCGADRYAFVENTVRCVSGVVTGATPSVTIDTNALGATAIATNDSVLICGTSNTGIDGGWKVTRVDDNNYQLAHRLFKLPSGYVSTCDCEYGLFGKLRFANAPSICGKVRVADASKTAPIRLTLNEKTWLRDGDKVKVEGAQGNTAANGLWTVLVQSPTEILLSGTSGNAPYSGGAIIYDIFGKGEQWNDTDAKGEFTVNQWTFNYRDVGEAARLQAQYINCNSCSHAPNPPSIRANQALWGMPSEVIAFACLSGCLPHTTCCPSVIAITPNAESWSNGVTYPFVSITADDRYGARWQAQVKQHVPDLLWTPPHKPCVQAYSDDGEGNITYPQNEIWLEDDGSCHQDGYVLGGDGITQTLVKYYPQRPWVESRCSIPDNAPGLPAGVYMGCLPLKALDTTTAPSGIVCGPPGQVGLAIGTANPNTCATPWGLYLRELSCVCGNVRPDFVPVYQADGVACAQEVPPP